MFFNHIFSASFTRFLLYTVKNRSGGPVLTSFRSSFRTDYRDVGISSAKLIFKFHALGRKSLNIEINFVRYKIQNEVKNYCLMFMNELHQLRKLDFEFRNYD